MVNDLQELMRENVAAPPPDQLDLGAVMRSGRRRVRGRRAAVAGGAAALALAVTAGLVFTGSDGTGGVDAADGPPAPDAPTITLADAERAVAGRDYRVLAQYTNRNLDRDNGQYFDGVTDDGLILFRDGPRRGQLYPRLALLEPGSEEKDWLPELRSIGQRDLRPVELGADRLVFLSSGDRALRGYVFDRADRSWRIMQWPSISGLEFPSGVMGPDGRLYVSVPNTEGKPPEGGWPTGSDGEADDSDAEGDTYRLWSVSLTDEDDVRDEDLTHGDVVFTESSMVWTDATNGEAGMVHVRDLASDEEHAFDPNSGERCNLLGFGATDERVVMSQYCGDYAGDVRDDRVQVLTTDGDQVVTLQDSGVEGGIASTRGDNPIVMVSAYDRDQGGSYVYDLGSDRFLRLSRDVSNFDLRGPAPAGQFLWHTPVNRRHGAKQWVGELVPAGD